MAKYIPMHSYRFNKIIDSTKWPNLMDTCSPTLKGQTYYVPEGRHLNKYSVHSKLNNAEHVEFKSVLKKQIFSLAKIMSHDMRGVLVSLAADLCLLDRGAYGGMEKSVAEKLQNLEAKVTQLIGVAEDFMGRACSADDFPEIEREDLHLKHDIVDPVLDELGAEIQQNNILINNRLGATSGKQLFIKADRFWLKSVFRNLLKNAIQYGGRECTIVIGCEDHGLYYLVNVYNSGRPIPEKFRDKLFKKFARISDRGNRSEDGLGLGLYLVKEVIQKHGGFIWYEALEYGSNFLFALQRC
jgi:signal transduction histidine kinase